MDSVYLPSQGLPEQGAEGEPSRPHLLVVRPHRLRRGGSAGVAPERTDRLDEVRVVWLGRLQLVGVAGLSAFVVAVLALHGIRANLNPAEHTISEYSLGSYGWLMRAAFVALGVGTLATAISVRIRYRIPGAWRHVAPVLLVGAAIGAFLDAGFNTDHLAVPETADGTVHSVGTAILVLALPGAAFVLGFAFVRNPTLALKAKVLLILGVAELGAIVLFEQSPMTVRGWAERSVTVFAIATLGLMQVLSRTNERTGSPQMVIRQQPSGDQSSFRPSRQATRPNASFDVEVPADCNKRRDVGNRSARGGA